MIYVHRPPSDTTLLEKKAALTFWGLSAMKNGVLLQNGNKCTPLRRICVLCWNYCDELATFWELAQMESSTSILEYDFVIQTLAFKQEEWKGKKTPEYCSS